MWTPLSTETAGPGVAWPFSLGAAPSIRNRSVSRTLADRRSWRPTCAPGHWISPLPAGHITGSSCAPIAHPWSAAACLRARSEEHTSELQSLAYLVCRLLLEKKKKRRERGRREKKKKRKKRKR